MAGLSHLHLLSLSGRLRASSVRLVIRGRKTKVEGIIFLGYGPEHNLWQDDMENCVKAYWAGKPKSEDLLCCFPMHSCSWEAYSCTCEKSASATWPKAPWLCAEVVLPKRTFVPNPALVFLNTLSKFEL